MSPLDRSLLLNGRYRTQYSQIGPQSSIEALEYYQTQVSLIPALSYKLWMYQF